MFNRLSPESLARASGARPLVVIALWLVLAVIALLITGRFLDSATTTELRLTGSAESEQARSLLENRLGTSEGITEIVIIQSATLTVDDPEFQEKVESVFAALVSLGPEIVAGGLNYYLTGDESLVAADRTVTIMPVIVAGELDEAIEKVEQVVHVTSEADRTDGFRVLLGGEASIAYENNELAVADLEKGERFGIPVALIILLIIFGTLVAALLPVGLAIVSIVVALGVTALIGQVFELSFFVTLMITMIGLAIGIDYSLLMVSRYREELRRGHSVREAVEKTGATAGRTVLFSGFTVVFALCGMLIIPSSFFQSLGLGAIIVVLVTLAATFTLLPATLTLLGTRVNSLRLPFFGRAAASRSGDSGGGFWDATTRAVTRFPIVSLVVVGGVMIAAAVFFFQINTGSNGVDAFPEGSFTRDAFFVLEEKGFSFGVIKPAEIVIDGDMDNPQVQEAIGNLAASIQSDPRFPLLPELETIPEANLAVLSVIITGEPSSRSAADAVKAIREQHIPGAFDGVPAEALVGGLSAANADFRGIVRTYTPVIFVFVLGLSFILLMVVFRSLVIPIKAIIMNLLSVGAAYGLLVIVFQMGVGASLFGFQQTDVIDLWIPLFLFSILFGLSMDYHVFLLSRIKERFDRSGDNTEAVAFGLRQGNRILNKYRK